MTREVGPGMPELGLASTSAGGRGTLTVSGELDIATAGALGDAIRAGLAAGPLTVDLSGVTFMDSTGLQALAVTTREAEERGWSLSFGGQLHESVRLVLRLTGMAEVLPFAGESASTG